MPINIEPDLSVYKLVNQVAKASTSLKHRRVMSYVSYEIENAVMSGRTSGRLFSGFQLMSKFIPQIPRYTKLAQQAEQVFVFGVPDVVLPKIENITYIPLKESDQLSKEWFAVLHGRNYYTALVTEELSDIHDPDATRIFQGVWTFDLDVIVILEKWLTRVVGAPSLGYDEGLYNHQKHIEIMTSSMGNLMNRSNFGNPSMTKSEPILAGELKTEVKENIAPKIRELKKQPQDKPALQEQDVVILFSDIRGFTKISETMPPSELVHKVINPYLDVSAKAIVNHHGSIDKFLGDGILAVFGLDDDHPADTSEAVQAAQEMIRNISALQANIEVGIGITRGKVFVDVIGSEEYREKTVIGDIVNVAQRLSDFGHNEIYLSHTAAETLAEQDNLVRYGEIELKGKSEPHLVYQITAS